MTPQNKTVKFPVWDQETDEIIDLEIDEDSYLAMCEAEKKSQEATRELKEYYDRIDSYAYLFAEDE